MSSNKLLTLIIEDTDEVLFEGEVDRITSFNEVGQFDIYPMHANFISIIIQQLDIYQDKKKVKEFPIEQAVLKVKKDEVHIFMGIETLLVDEAPVAPLSDRVKK